MSWKKHHSLLLLILFSLIISCDQDGAPYSDSTPIIEEGVTSLNPSVCEKITSLPDNYNCYNKVNEAINSISL